jgi:hypothetical protein
LIKKDWIEPEKLQPFKNLITLYPPNSLSRKQGQALVRLKLLHFSNMINRQVIPTVDPPDAVLVKQAEAAIAQFEKSIAPSAWDFLDKATIIAEMRSRINNPFLVNQGKQPFCGPASVLFELVRTAPVRYVEICQTLFLTGGFSGKTKFIMASDPLRHASRGNLQMGQADWMILATMRDMENILFAVAPNTPEIIRNLAGMTKPWELQGWLTEILGYSTVKYHQAYLSNDIQALTAAANAFQSGGSAFALVTAEGLLAGNPPPIPLPTHWITIMGNLRVQKNTIDFDIYTWARKMHLEMDLGSLKKYLWAVVTGI